MIGASVLYPLTKFGWRDVVLLERAELTAGSTWHAAGGVYTLNGDVDVASLKAYAIDLYKDIERISGVSCGLDQTGCFVYGPPLAKLTSPAFCPTVGYALAFAYLPPDLDAQSAPDIRVQVLSQRLPARILREPPYDPQGLKLRA